MRRKKGFTLMELIIVITIFGVLVALITPAWAHWAARSKFKGQDQKAKTVFNAAQTALVDLEFGERKYRGVYSSTTDETQKNIAIQRLYTIDAAGNDISNDWYFYWDGSEGYQCTANGTRITASGDPKKQETLDEWNSRIASNINRIVDEDLIYKFKVSDYKVVAVSTGNSITDRFIGGHPTSILTLRSKGAIPKIGGHAVEKTNARAVNLEWFDSDVAVNPAAANAS